MYVVHRIALRNALCALDPYNAQVARSVARVMNDKPIRPFVVSMFAC